MRRRSPGRCVGPRCERLEERLKFALFNVTTPLLFSGLNNNGSVAVGDLNKDGFTDAVLTNFGTDYGTGAGTTIIVLYGRSGGGFNRISLNTGGANVSFVSIADMNGDSWPDVAVTNENHQNTGTVSIFRNDGAGNLILVGTPFSSFGFNPKRVGLADLSGDGILDAIAVNLGKDNGSGSVIGNNITVFQGNTDAMGHGNFTFSSSPITTLAPTLAPGQVFAPTSLVLADLDGDGLKDITTAVPDTPSDFGTPQGPGHVFIFRGTGSGGFAAPLQFGSGGVSPVDVKAGYLDGDNKLDLVVANSGDPNANPEFSGDGIGVLLNTSPGPGNVNFGATTSIPDNTYGSFAVALDDFNLDGKADITSVNYGSQTFSPAAFVSVYLGNGAGTSTPASPATYDTQTGVGGGQYLAAGDFDHNGTPDLIVAHASNRVGMLINTFAGKTWIGPDNGGDWGTASNWGPSGVPTTSDAPLIWGSKSVTLSASATVAGLTLTGGALLTMGADGQRILQTSGLVIAPGSKINLTNNKLTVAGGNLAAITELIVLGRNGGAWNGAGGIVTSSGSGNFTTLGVGATGGIVTVRFTYGGDATLDGKLNIDDYVKIDNGISTGVTGWSNGDFNYDGKINIDDYVIIDTNIASQPPPLGSAGGMNAAWTSAPALVWKGPADDWGDAALREVLA